MSASRPLSLPPPASPRPAHPWWLERLARHLADDDRVPLGPQLFWVVVPPDDDRHLGPVLSYSALDPYDPIADLYGKVAPAEVMAIGFVGEVRARRLRGDHPRRIVRDGRLVHLAHRDGTEVRALPSGPRSPAAVTVPTRVPSASPIGDACRRMLGQPAAPAPGHTIDWWLENWAHCLFLLAIGGADTSWRALATWTVGRGAVTPSEIAQAAVLLGRTRSWADLRREALDRARRHAAGDEPDNCSSPLWPFCDPDLLAWMDVGTFARARLGHQPPLATLLDDLDDLLQPGVADLVRATVTLALGEARGAVGI
jgi:hypothetical protein